MRRCTSFWGLCRLLWENPPCWAENPAERTWPPHLQPSAFSRACAWPPCGLGRSTGPGLAAGHQPRIRSSQARGPATAMEARAPAAAALPELCVFDLDMCMWDPEMYTISSSPSQAIKGDLGGAGEGVVGASNGQQTVKLFPGALLALQVCVQIAHLQQRGHAGILERRAADRLPWLALWVCAKECAAGKYAGMRLAVASSADTPKAVVCAKCAFWLCLAPHSPPHPPNCCCCCSLRRKSLAMLEVVPGLTFAQLLERGALRHAHCEVLVTAVLATLYGFSVVTLVLLVPCAWDDNVFAMAVRLPCWLRRQPPNWPIGTTKCTLPGSSCDQQRDIVLRYTTD